MTDPVELLRRIADELWATAPPKIEGGSPARAQFLTDVLAVQKAAHAFDLDHEWVEAINGEDKPEPDAIAAYDYESEGLGGT